MDIGPSASLCINSSFSAEQIFPTGLNGLLCILPSMHPTQKDNFSDFKISMPFIRFLLTISQMFPVLLYIQHLVSLNLTNLPLDAAALAEKYACKLWHLQYLLDLTLLGSTLYKLHLYADISFTNCINCLTIT